jgi:hypothetical protein
MNTAVFRRWLTVFAGMVGVSALRAEEAADSGEWELFNGKDLAGWKVPAPNPFWKVVDGVLVGENDPAKKGSMLYTEAEYKDFEFEAEARWEGEIDSGFMVRRKVGSDKVPGDLQMQIGVSRSLKRDMTGSFYVGGYPEAGQAKEGEKLLKKGDWNHFRLVVKGDTVTVFINGAKASEYTDARYPEAGPIGLQIHGGLAMKIEFRKMKIRPIAKLALR